MTSFLSDLVIYLLFGLSIGGIYALIAVGLTLILGIMDVVNLAHGEFVMLGGYVVYWLTVLYGVPYFASLPLAFLLVGLLAVAVERAVFRQLYDKPMLVSILASIGLLILIENTTLFAWSGVERFVKDPFGSLTFRMGEVFLPAVRVFAIAVAFLLFLALWLFLKRTRMGKAMRAVAQNREGALVYGINLGAVGVLSFFIGAGMSAVAGGVYGAIFSIYPTMGLLMVLKALAIIIIGGMGSVFGSFVAGIIAGVLESVVVGFIPSLQPYRDVLTFMLLVVVLLIRPKGLLGEW